MLDRREALRCSLTVAGLMAGVGLWPRQALAAWNQAAFDGRHLADVAKALGGSAPAESKDVTLMAPDMAEDGATVSVGVACALPGVRRLALLVEKNPSPLVAVFELTDFVEPQANFRVKMAESSRVYAVAMMADARVLFAQREVKVTLGGCGA